MPLSGEKAAPVIRYFSGMSRTQLVPEQRPTKDGLLVTRWVKEGKKAKKQSSLSGSLPAPGIALQMPAVTRPKGQKKAEKEARLAENARQMDYVQTEARLRIKYRGHHTISSVEVSGVLKALRDEGVEDPSSIVDEDLLISYREFRDLVWTPFHENKDHSIELLNDSEIFRSQVNKLSAHYVVRPEDRERLARIVRSGVYTHEEAMKALNSGR